MKKIGIGYENYKEFIDEKLYYVDKTLMNMNIERKDECFVEICGI